MNEVKQLAITDVLTSLYNRRHTMERLEDEIDVVLFDRKKTPIITTDCGKEIIVEPHRLRDLETGKHKNLFCSKKCANIFHTTSIIKMVM